MALYQRTGRILEAYNLCSELENRHMWPGSREWYSCLVEMAENYQVRKMFNYSICASFMIHNYLNTTYY